MGKLQNFKSRFNKELEFLKKNGRLTDDWSNVYEHCFKEGLIALILSELLELKKTDQENLVKAAILHDWYKRNEREAVIAKGYNQYNIAFKKSGLLLKQFGYNATIINLTRSVGHASLKKILKTNIFLKRLMHYIDDVTFETNLVEIDKRVDQLEAAPRYKELNQSGKEIFNGKTYFQIQRELGKEIEKEISLKLEIHPSELIPKMQERLDEFK